MAWGSAVTTVTTVTKKRGIPPLRVTQIDCGVVRALLRNSAGGIIKKPVTPVTAVTGRGGVA